MPIDSKMVKWDEPTTSAIDPKMVKWDDAEKPKGEITRTEKVLKGARDPIDGGAQLLTKLLPDGVVNAGNSFNNWLADKTWLVGRLPEGGVNQQVQDAEKEYQAKRAAAGESGIDGYRILGNVASPANFAVAARTASLVTKAPSLTNAAASGALTSLLAPVTGGDFWTEKAKQGASGAVGGGVSHGATSALARVISPNASVNPQLALLRSEGVRPTIGQTLGGVANRIEEKLQSAPILGDAIAAARQRSSDDLARAAVNRSLAPIGEKLPNGVAGNDAILFARKALGDSYDSILPAMKVQKDVPFAQSVASLKTMVSQGAIGNGTKRQFDSFIKNEVNPLFQGNQAMTGETLKRLQSKITDQIRRTQASTNADERLLSDAYKELGDQLTQLSTRSNPSLAGKLQSVNEGWANFKRVQRAASSVAAEDGAFNPAQLHNAVKAADRSKDKARFAEGNALMQDLSSAGKNLLSNKVPNSGTVDRALLAGGALGSALYNPLIPASLVGGAALYSAPAQALLRGLATARPQAAQGAAQAVRKSTPYLVPIGQQGLLGLGQN